MEKKQKLDGVDIKPIVNNDIIVESGPVAYDPEGENHYILEKKQLLSWISI